MLTALVALDTGEGTLGIRLLRVLAVVCLLVRNLAHGVLDVLLVSVANVVILIESQVVKVSVLLQARAPPRLLDTLEHFPWVDLLHLEDLAI